MASSIVSIPLNRLVHSRSNVRRTGRDRGLESLVASIAAHGLRQNLNVRKSTGHRYEVVAGGRRLEALKRLAKEGQLHKDAEIPCFVLSDSENATELSLVENAVRSDMHPDDQCSAFATLLEEGLSTDDVAARFGVTTRTVVQRLKLASVSPTLRALYRKGEIDTAQMMALALVDDHNAQEAAWTQLPEWSRQPEAIRRALTAEGLSGDHRLARFVGTDAYRAAGGEVVEDLFDDRPPILVNAGLVQVLAAAKLEETATAVRLEGWHWVEVETVPNYGINYGRILPSSPADDPNGERKYTDDDLARAGARVILTYNGEVIIERGLLSPEAMKAERKVEDPGGQVVKGMSDAMIADLSSHRTAALRLALAKDPAVGLAATVHALLLNIFYPGEAQLSCLDLSTRPALLTVTDNEECTAHSDLEALIAEYRTGLPDRAQELWGWCLAQDQPTLLRCLSLAVGLSVDAVMHRGGSSNGRLDHAHQLSEALAFEMRDYWRPKVTCFFSRLTKALMSKFLRETGEPQLADDILKLGKAAAAERTAAHLVSAKWQPAVFRKDVAAESNLPG